MNEVAHWKTFSSSALFAVGVFGAYGDGATAILQQLVRKRSEHTSTTVGACKRLAFQSLSVAMQTANARMLRSRKALDSPLSLLPQRPGAAS
jgi:Ni2+-binding GTPase involved in maturation of urease and hydrogenase